MCRASPVVFELQMHPDTRPVGIGPIATLARRRLVSSDTVADRDARHLLSGMLPSRFPPTDIWKRRGWYADVQSAIRWIDVRPGRPAPMRRQYLASCTPDAGRAGHNFELRKPWKIELKYSVQAPDERDTLFGWRAVAHLMSVVE